MSEKEFESLEEIAKDIKESQKKISLLYAFNATGKTRLSIIFKNLINGSISKESDEGREVKRILYFNAFTEDLFSWNNDLDNDEDRFLTYDKRTYFGRFLEDQQKFDDIIVTYKKYVGDEITPVFDDIFVKRLDVFGNPVKDINGDFIEDSFSKSIRFEREEQVVKISRGEERIFIWSIFVTLIDIIIDDLLDSPENSDFIDFKYIYIDDPISSLDENNIINTAIFLKEVIAKSQNTDLKFIVSTHQALFYNALYNEIRFEKRIKKKIFYVMKKEKQLIGAQEKEQYILTDVEKDSPFGYHLKIIDDIKQAIKKENIERFHFALFRSILEKTSNYLGYGNWEEVLFGLYIGENRISKENIELYSQRIDFYTHNRYSELEYKETFAQDKRMFIALFNSFIESYKFESEDNID